MSFEVTPVATKRDLDEFIRFPWAIYADDENWVPPLISAEEKMLDPKRNPFYKHAEAQHFLARREGEIVGRISAIVNHAHNEFHKEKTGFWGYYECEREQLTATSLFKAAEDWMRSKGVSRALGPANPSMSDSCGLLVEGFKWSPYVLMTYNPRIYVAQVELAGYKKAMDLLAYIIVHTDVDREKVDRIAKRVTDSHKVVIRNVNMGRFEDELRVVMEIYNDAWEKNWGFVPMTPEEVRFAADDMKAIVLPELVYFAYVDGEPAGFALALPDINHALKKCNGTLWPFGWWHFLKFRLRTIPTFRVVALGLKKKFQHIGIGALFYQRYLNQHMERGYIAAEMSWILATNEAMNRPIEMIGGKPYKTYRMYEKTIPPMPGSGILTE